MGKVGFEGELWMGDGDWPSCDPLMVDGSRVWVNFKDSKMQGWDFGTLGSASILLPNESPESPDLEFTAKRRIIKQCRIKHKVTGKDVFQLSGRYADPNDVRWDGRYLVAGYRSGEMLIFDFGPMLPSQRHVVCWPSGLCRSWVSQTHAGICCRFTSSCSHCFSE